MRLLVHNIIFGIINHNLSGDTMVNRKMLIILSVFLALVVFMGSASAAGDNVALGTDEVVDLSDEILAVEESSAGNDDSGLELEGNVLKTSNDNENIGATVTVVGNTFADIQSTIDSSNPGDTIILNGLYTGSGTQIEVNKKNLTFIGTNDATLDAKGLSRILYITANDITLKGISFVNGKETNLDGGAIEWISNGMNKNNGTIFNCSFVNNSARYGSAIHWQGDGAVFNCSFENNTGAISGGAIHWASYTYWSNWIYVKGTVSDSTFVNNNAQSGGAIYWLRVDGTISNSSFVNNAANGSVPREGGALYLSNCNNAKVSNCSFENNTAGEYAGAIMWYNGNNGTVSNCSFINNNATNSGAGAIYWSGPNGAVLDCSFENNHAPVGGAIDWNSYWGKVSNCSFESNTAKRDGGAIFWYNNNNGVVSNCSFESNTAGKEGGAIFWDASYGSVLDSSFESNTANYGGAISWKSFNGAVSNSTFENNTAANNGGAINWGSSDGTISDSSFVNNAANNYYDGAGGAIYLGGYNTALSNSSFENNTANNGGAIYWNSGKGKLSDSSFVNNTAADGYFDSSGGAIYWYGADGNVLNSSFDYNTAERKGGAIYWDGADGAVSDSSFENNDATNNYYGAGGAIYWHRNGAVSDSIFIDNKCPSATLVLSDNSLKFTGKENYINGIYTEQDVSFDNVTFWNGNVVNTDDADAIKSNLEAGINITLEVYDSQGQLVDNVTNMTDTSGQIFYNYSYLSPGEYTLKAYHPDDRYYTYIENTMTFSIKKYDIVVLNNQTIYYSETPTTVRLNATIQDSETKELINPNNVKLVFILQNGTEIEATYENGIWVADCTFEEFSTYLVVARIEPEEFKLNGSQYSLGEIFPGSIVIEEPLVDIELLLEVSSNNVEYGDIFELIVTVRNNGPFDATNVIADISIPDGFIYIWDSINGDPIDRAILRAAQQTYDKSTGKWSIGDLANGESTTMTIQLRADYVGEKEIAASSKADEQESDLTNNNKSLTVKSIKESEPDNETEIPDDDVPDEDDTDSDTPEDQDGTPDENTGSNQPFENALSKHSTGNPILALLLVLIALGSAPIRKFKK